MSGLVGDIACRLDKKKTLKENIDSLKFILDKELGKNTKIIYPSSCSVYGLIDKAAAEDHNLNPQSLYAETKIICESMLKNLSKKIDFEISKLEDEIDIIGKLQSKDDLASNNNNYDLKIIDIKKKITIDALWNELIIKKYSSKVVINEAAIKKELLKNSKIQSNEYQLSEIIFEVENKEEIQQNYWQR